MQNSRFRTTPRFPSRRNKKEIIYLIIITLPTSSHNKNISIDNSLVKLGLKSVREFTRENRGERKECEIMIGLSFGHDFSREYFLMLHRKQCGVSEKKKKRSNLITMGNSPSLQFSIFVCLPIASSTHLKCRLIIKILSSRVIVFNNRVVRKILTIFLHTPKVASMARVKPYLTCTEKLNIYYVLRVFHFRIVSCKCKINRDIFSYLLISFFSPPYFEIRFLQV